MSEAPQQFETVIATEMPSYVPEQVGRITVLEALAEETANIGPSRSNRTTIPAGDADDQ